MCLWCIFPAGIVQEVPEKSVVQFLSCTWQAGRRQKHLGSESTRMLLIDVMLVLTECGGVRALFVFYSCQRCVKNESSVWTDCTSDYSLLGKKDVANPVGWSRSIPIQVGEFVWMSDV